MKQEKKKRERKKKRKERNKKNKKKTKRNRRNLPGRSRSSIPALGCRALLPVRRHFVDP